MKRTSTDAEYLDSGKLVIDADGVPFEPASKGYVDQRVPIDSLTGTGSPEGKVAAPVGSVYTDTAATNGAIRWIKSSGAGNTGWRVEYGDTGWREIPLITGTGRALVRRTEKSVTLRLVGVALEGNYAVHVVVLPSGFRWAAPQTFLTVSPTDGKASVWSMYSGASVSWLRNTTGTFDRPTTPQSGSVAFDTGDPWPTTLPGTPA